MPQALADGPPAAWLAQKLPSLLRPSCVRPSALAVPASPVHAASWLRAASCSPPRSPLCWPAECMSEFSMPRQAGRALCYAKQSAASRRYSLYHVLKEEGCLGRSKSALKDLSKSWAMG
jgi:hypothetical protein